MNCDQLKCRLGFESFVSSLLEENVGLVLDYFAIGRSNVSIDRVVCIIRSSLKQIILVV